MSLDTHGNGGDRTALMANQSDIQTPLRKGTDSPVESPDLSKNAPNVKLPLPKDFKCVDSRTKYLINSSYFISPSTNPKWGLRNGRSMKAQRVSKVVE